MIAGQKVKLFVSFKDENGTAADPTNVFLKYRVNNGTPVTLQYPTGIVKTGTGEYYYIVDTTDLPGQWGCRWYSTGNVQTTHPKVTFQVDVADP